MTENKSIDIRAALRKAAMNNKEYFKKEIVIFEGNKFEIREPSIRLREEILEKIGIKEDALGKQKTPGGRSLIVWGAIYLTYVPDTDIKVFEVSDYETLDQGPCNGLIDKLGTKAISLINPDIELKKKDSVKTEELS